MSLIDSAYSRLLSRAMDGYSLRQRVTASNISHADTPDYARKEVRFEEELRRADEQGGIDEMNKVTPSIEWTEDPVVLEDELLEMSDTQVRVNVATRSLRHHFEMMRTGITGMNR
ncbi:MAG: hypothetical protein WEA36_10625 [Balneolaceae bacterium]